MLHEVRCGKQPDGAIDLDLKPRTRVVDERHALTEAHGVRGLAVDIPLPPIDRVGDLPMIEIERIALFEVQTELSALGTEPEPVFAAKHIDVRLSLPCRDRCTAYPPKAWRVCTTGRARHHAPLILRCNHDLRRTGGVGERHDLRVLPEKCEIGF